jgi:cell division protein FtsB
MIKYVFSGLCGVLSTGAMVGLPMYARFVTVEASITQMAKSMDQLATQVYQLKMEVVELQTTNNLLNHEVKEHMHGPTED